MVVGVQLPPGLQTLNNQKINKMEEQLKHCSKCGRDLPLSEFYLSRTRGTYQAWCKDCQKARCRTAENKQRRKESYAIKALRMANQVESGKYAEEIKKTVEMTKPIEKPKPIAKPIKEPTLNELVITVKKHKDFDLKDFFTPRELINAIYDLGYRGELSIMIEHKVKLSHEENSSNLFTH